MGLQFAAVGGTGVGDFCVVTIVADGWCRGVVSLGAVGCVAGVLLPWKDWGDGGAAGCIAVVLLPWKGWEDGGAGGLSKGGEVERLRG